MQWTPIDHPRSARGLQTLPALLKYPIVLKMPCWFHSPGTDAVVGVLPCVLPGGP